ncbi:hypothetical protein DH2020_006139 [Rehmannia glutinosa]|uniref:Eukaryotic translation initiation factor 4C n=2 Tax=Rehmannia glutinosa TaxID=99300 RepID=A0ABR0XI84_REHGL
MDSDSNSSATGGRDPDFGFAFNDSNFSDRVLRIEIIADPPDARPDSEGCRTLADWAARKSKRRRGDVMKKGNALDINNCPEEQILDCQQPDIDDANDGIGDENHDEEEIPMIEDSPSGDEAANSDDSTWSKIVQDYSQMVNITVVFANSILNGTEEAALMELLNFMYSSALNADTAPALLDVLMAADKFEVASCMRHCSRRLRNLPMTPESALLYLDLPSSVLMADAVQPLTDAAKQFLAARYKDLSKFQDEVMKLPLAGIEAILSSDDLQDSLSKARGASGYPLFSFKSIYSFPLHDLRKLKKVLACNDFDHDYATKAVLDALFFKAEAPHRQRIYATEESTSTSSRFIERAYKYRPVKVVEFEVPRQQCVVYLDLKREECANLFPSGEFILKLSTWVDKGSSCPHIVTWINRARFIVLVFSWGCKKRVQLHLLSTMNLPRGQNLRKSILANIRVTILLLAERREEKVMLTFVVEIASARVSGLLLGWGSTVMPKNKGKGGKNRKRGKNEADDEKRELMFKEDGQEYAQVLRMLGNGRCEAMCIDGVKRLCHIRGKMHKKVWIAAGDIILVGLRDYQDDKADVILKYMPDEARLLKAYGELPENTRLNEGIAGGLDEEEDGAGDDYIEFEDEDIDKL